MIIKNKLYQIAFLWQLIGCEEFLLDFAGDFFICDVVFALKNICRHNNSSYRCFALCFRIDDWHISHFFWIDIVESFLQNFVHIENFDIASKFFYELFRKCLFSTESLAKYRYFKVKALRH